MNESAVGREHAANVLFHFRGEGYPGGSFTEALLVTIGKADVGNRYRLSHGFPGYVMAVDMAMNHPDGLDRLRAIYKGE